MTAGVQSFEPAAAYLPSPSSNPCSQSKVDAKGLGAASGGEDSDFQSEMDLQDARPEPKSADHSVADHSVNGPAKTVNGPAKNAGKKQRERPDNDEAAAAPVAVTPAQVVEPQRHVLPITFAPLTSAPIEPDETVDDATQANTSQDQASQEAALQAGVSNDIVLMPAVSPAEELPQPRPTTAQNEVIPTKTEQTVPVQKPPAILKSTATGRSSEAADSVPARKVAPESQGLESVPQAPAQSATAPVTTIPTATGPIPRNPAAPGQPAASGQTRTRELPPVSQPELKVPELTPLESAPAAATQKVEDAPANSPSALAFAARLTAVQQPSQTDPTIPKNPTRPAVGADAPAATRIPVRYAATAQIIQRAEQKNTGALKSQVDPIKYAGPVFDRSARPDFVVGPSATNDTAKSSQSQPIPDPLPTLRTERIIEPPVAAPTSSRDIRVQVPDNNGGTTQVRFLETGGEVRVSVRTADTGLAQSLRSHLNDLSLRLAEGGVPAEIWKPAPGAASSQNDQHQPDREGRGSEGRHSGSHARGQAGTQSDQQDQQERPAWLEEMEASLLARK